MPRQPDLLRSDRVDNESAVRLWLPYPMELGVETADRIRAAVEEMLAPLSRTSWRWSLPAPSRQCG